MQKNTDVTIAVVHGSIELGRLEHNIHRIEEAAERAKTEGTEIMLLPAMVNGVPLFDLRKNLRIKRATETIPGRTSEHLAKIAYRSNLYLIVGPILERRGSKVYRSAFVIEPSMNIKYVVSQVLTPTNFGQSPSIPVITIKNINIGIFIAEDIHLPELSLLMKIWGVSMIIFYPYPQVSIDKMVAMLKTRALELKSIVISIGFTLWRKNEEIMFMPTTIVDENGVVVHEVLDKSMKIIKMSIPYNNKQKQYPLSPAHKKLLKLLSRSLLYYTKKQ